MKKKLDLLNLNEAERKKATAKFLATFALVSEEELREVTGYLNTQNVQITKAREIKVVANSKEEIAKKFNILSEIHETDIYRQDPSKISHNVIDIYKKIQYCKQIGKSYKKEDGTYEPFLFNERLWKQVISRENEQNEQMTSEFILPEEEIITLDPNSVQSNNVDTYEAVPINPIIDDSKYMDIKDYMAADNDMKQLEEQTTNFSTIRQELEGQLAELDALKSLNFGDEISFGDYEPESFGRR